MNRDDLQSTIARLDSEEKRAIELQRENTEKKKKTSDQIILLTKNIKNNSDLIECLGTAQTKAEQILNSLIIPQTEKNTFKLWISAIFALMVLVVICGFFTVAGRDELVRRAIFSNQTGIQFVTLFSLVIAIILFGITDILQAKELSALLGGVSGYILGRVTTDSQTAQPSVPAKRPPMVFGAGFAFHAPNIVRYQPGGLDHFETNARVQIVGTTTNDGIYTIKSATGTEILMIEQTIQNETPTGGVGIVGL